MRFFYLFSALLIGELFAVAMDIKSLEFVFKPSLMLVLALFFYQKTVNAVNKKQRNRILASLLFSLLGDILMLVSGGFIFGLGAFLIAHLWYISAFFLDNNTLIFKNKDRILPTIGILAYTLVFLSYVLPKVETALFFPILCYGITIMVMLLTALNRWKNVEINSFNWVIFGAILFVISDCILAINRFVSPINFEDILIMATYAIGQYLIIFGVLKNLKFD